MKSTFVLLFTLVLLSACVQTTPTGAYPPPVASTSTGIFPPDVTTTSPPTGSAVYPGPTSALTQPYPAPSQTPFELTAAQEAAEQALAKKYNLQIDQVKIVSTEAVTWPNGCLGVVIPGILCTDVLVDGFRIIMEANGQPYEFHTNQDGTSVVDAAQQLATLGFVVVTSAQQIQVVNPQFPLGPTYNPAFNGFLPVGGTISGTAYVLDISHNKAIAVDASGSKDLAFIQNPTYGLAIWRGGPGTSPRLAWGSQPLGGPGPYSLQISAPDGSGLETLLTLDAQANPPFALVAEFWSADGESLYFSKEPVGIGGYILFSGASSLFKINIKTKEVTEIIPQAPLTSPQTCLDAISGDYRFVADHCTANVVTIRDLQSGGSVTIQAPSGVNGYQVVGSARFSPSGDRVAFALAKSNPDDEQGWIAVGDSSGGVSRLVLTGDAGSYYTVQGWLDDQTLLVQSIAIGCADCSNQLFTVGVDGSKPTGVAEGSLLVVLDNR